MGHYRHRQVAKLILALMGVSFLGTAGILVASEVPPPIFVSVAFVGVAFSLLFWCLNVEVDAERVRIWFGFGLIRKTFELSQVVTVKAVRNRWWYGLGIRLTPHGWMFNVEGLDAVEIELRGGRTFRIGTDEPDRLVAAIEGGIGPST